VISDSTRCQQVVNSNILIDGDIDFQAMVCQSNYFCQTCRFELLRVTQYILNVEIT
jgi:hypothetical protein